MYDYYYDMIQNKHGARRTKRYLHLFRFFKIQIASSILIYYFNMSAKYFFGNLKAYFLRHNTLFPPQVSECVRYLFLNSLFKFPYQFDHPDKLYQIPKTITRL